MLFPKNRLRFTKTYQGKEDPEGWLVLEITALELDGVNKIYLPVADVEKIMQSGDSAADRLKQARALLGGFAGDGEA